jgi:hypothetical protein
VPLPVPNLDDRDYASLLAEARALVPARCPEWTDLSPGDPGETLLELFAYLTDTLLYRVNRLPEKAFVAFLNLIGVQLAPPTAASVVLRFSAPRRADAEPAEITVARGTRVTVGGPSRSAADPIFVTTNAVTIPVGGTVDVIALHCEPIAGELAGAGTGRPGLSVRVARPPIVQATADGLDLVVGVEARADELEARAETIRLEDKAFRVWREVAEFGGSSSPSTDPHVYLADRSTGTITFAPAVRGVDESGGVTEAAEALGAVPDEGREIRVWYRRGGGAGGNVAAGTLTVMRDNLPGVEVINPSPATGGRDGETIDNALVRGPQQLRSLERAVTARDFELAALRSSGAVARARAFTRSALWAHARPGTVEVLLVPAAPSTAAALGISASAMESLQTPDALATVATDLDGRRPMGTLCTVTWARYKTVRVASRVVVHRTEDTDAVRARMVERLRAAINPLPAGDAPGWRFGEALRASNVYDVLLREPGVRYVDRVSLLVDEVPDDAADLVADMFQPRTWWCGSGGTVFRSTDDGDGWEPSGRFPGETVTLVRTSKELAGLVVAVSSVEGATGTRVRISRDCGETWEPAAEVDLRVEDLVVIRRDDGLVALVATDKGLFELALRHGGTPVQVLVDASHQDQGFYAVAAWSSTQGSSLVALAAQDLGGVLLSAQGGRPGTFRQLGAMQGRDIRVLAVRENGPRRFLLAGVTAPSGNDPGEGAHMVEIADTEIDPRGWQPLTSGWAAGSCQSLATRGSTVLAASHRLGVLRLELATAEPAWQPAGVDSGLALRDPGRFAPLSAVVVAPDGGLVMACGPVTGGPSTGGVAAGVHRSMDGGITFESVFERTFADKVTLPATWLFCSGQHEIEVVTDDAAT